MKILRVLFIFMIAVSLLFLPAVTKADTTNIQFTGFQNYGDGLLSGEIYFNWINPDKTGPLSYCVDRSRYVYVPGIYWADVEPLSTKGLQQAAWLMDAYSPDIKGRGPNPTEAYALQLAIWSVTGQLGITNIEQAISISAYPSSLADMATQMLNSIPQTINMNDKYALLEIFNNSSMTVQYQSQLAPVPIPAAAWLLGSGLIGLIGIRRRIRS